MSITAGLQVPAIPLLEVPGKVGTVLPAQMVSVLPKLNTGIVFGVTVTLRVVATAHCPAVGVKV